MKDFIKIPLQSKAAQQIMGHRAKEMCRTDICLTILRNSINEYTTISTNYKEMFSALDVETFLKAAPIKIPKEYL